MNPAQYTDWYIDFNRVENGRDELENQCLQWLTDRGKITGYVEIEWLFQPDAIIAKFKHERAFGVRIPIEELQ